MRRAAVKQYNRAAVRPHDTVQSQRDAPGRLAALDLKRDGRCDQPARVPAVPRSRNAK